MFRNLLILLVFVSVSACVTTHRIPIETLQPARVSFEFPKTNIVISASQALWDEAAMLANSANADSLIANILYSVKILLEILPGYDSSEFLVIADANNDIQNEFDMLIQLDGLRINNTYYGQQHSYFEWEAFLHVHYAARWSIRNGSGDIVNEYSDRDLMMWRSGAFLTRDIAVENLPKVSDAWWDTGVTIAERFAARIAPQWQTSTRTIYDIENFYDLSQMAHTAMRNHAYWRAFDIWETMLMGCRKRGQKNLKSRITYNMAVALEFQNELDMAIHWAQRSVSFKQSNRNENYLRLLQDRQKNMRLLDAQLGKINE